MRSATCLRALLRTLRSLAVVRLRRLRAPVFRFAQASASRIFVKYLFFSYLQYIRYSDKVTTSVFRISMMPPSPPPSQTLVTALQLGQLLKAERKRRKITQAQVGARLGLSQNRVSHLEQHPEDLSFKQLLGWCAVIGLHLDLRRERESPESTSNVEW